MAVQEHEINWTRNMLKRFRTVYTEAVLQGDEQFTFDGHTFITRYAKYLIEYLTWRFK